MAEGTPHTFIVPSGTIVGPRKICYVCTWNSLGGTETLILRHVRWLRDHGFCAVVISPRGAMSEEYRGAAASFIELTEAQSDHAGMTEQEQAERDDQVADTLGRVTPCHFVAFNADGIRMAAELCSRIKGSAVSTYLIFDDIYGPEKLAYLEEMNEAGMVLSMNEGCLEGHRKRFGYRLERSVVVPLPMVLPPIGNRRTPSDECHILTVARLVDMKGYVEGLIHDLAEITLKQGLPCRLIVVGDGPLRSRFEQVAERCGVASRIRFVGSVPYAELLEYYTQADIFVGMGTTVLEAASVGVPVIVATASTTQFITPGLFGADDRLDLGEPYCRAPLLQGREILKELILSTQMRERFGLAGRAKVLAQFEQDVVMREFLRLLEQNAFRLEGIPRPAHRVPFAKLRQAVKRCFGYHPLVMWIGRKISLSVRHMAAAIRRADPKA